jgi:hypothetical protein
MAEETMNHFILSGLINEKDILIPFIEVLPMLLTDSLYGELSATSIPQSASTTTVEVTNKFYLLTLLG